MNGIVSFDPAWGSHIPVLAKVMQMSHGPVMELGIGIYSSPLLHLYCRAQGRTLESYEHEKNWANLFKDFIQSYHTITQVDNWDTIPIEKQHWGVIFVDHESSRRSIEAIRAANYADFVVLHDTNGRMNPIYHWDLVYPHYKYQYHFDKTYPHTTVVSNFIPVENLWTI